MTSPGGSFFVSQVAWNLPAILVAIVGITLALRRWQRHPNVSQLTLVAFSLLLASRLIAISFPFWQPTAGSYAIPIVRLSSLLILVASQGLLIAAIFGWRSSPNTFEQGN